MNDNNCANNKVFLMLIRIAEYNKIGNDIIGQTEQVRRVIIEADSKKEAIKKLYADYPSPFLFSITELTEEEMLEMKE